MKTKRIIAAITALTILGGAFPISTFSHNFITSANAATDVITLKSKNAPNELVQNNVKYELYSDHAVVVCASPKYNESLTEVVIPDEIEGLPVIEIKEEAFYASDLVNVKLGKNIKIIGEYAFYNTELTEIELPESLEEIGSYAFAYCSELEKVIFNDNLQSIGRYAFTYCRTLTSVELPNSLVRIDKGAFKKCNKTDVKLGSSIKYIGDEAFASCNILGNIELADGIVSIGKDAFNDDNIDSIVIPASINTLNGCPLYSYSEDDKTYDTAIIIKNSECKLSSNGTDWSKFIIVCEENSEPQKFAKENNLRFCTPEQYEKGEYEKEPKPFEDEEFSILDLGTMKCTMYADRCYVYDISMGDGEEIIIPDEIEGVPVVEVSIEIDSYKNNTQVKRIVFGKNVRRINGIFLEYSSLEEVVFGENIEEIRSFLFHNCTSLKKVSFKYNPDSGCSLKELGSYTFELNPIKMMILPESVEYIERCAVYARGPWETEGYSRVAVLNPECYFEPAAIIGDNNLIIYGFSNSTAEKYALDNDIMFMKIDSVEELSNLESTTDFKYPDPFYVDRLAGDTNCDGQIDLADAVLIMQALSNPNRYGLNGSDPKHITDQGVINGDVHNPQSGITSTDALWIQDYLLGDFDSFD